MCDFCEKEKIMMQETQVNVNMIPWTVGIKNTGLWRYEYESGVFIDTRGYLRMVDLDDCNCLDAGEKIKINFCPICGNKITQEC